jgi:hypothetical protein
MNPTNYLRFVKRVIPIREHNEPDTLHVVVGREVTVLQQLWESPTKVDLITGEFLSEWRDVPTEEA